MTEAEWLACTDPQRMLAQYLGGRQWPYLGLSDRKLRLFACACHPGEPLWQKWADGELPTEVMSAEEGARHSVGEHVGQHHATRLPAEEKTKRADLLRHLIGNPFRPPLWQTCERCGNGCWPGKVVTTKKHYTGEGMQIVSAPDCPDCSGRGWLEVQVPSREVSCPACTDKTGFCWGKVADCRTCHGSGTGRISDFPDAVTALAEALYAGEDCAFALHDALLEAGMPELAEHFAERETYCERCAGMREALGPSLSSSKNNPLAAELAACVCRGTPLAGHPRGCWAVDLILGKH